MQPFPRSILAVVTKEPHPTGFDTAALFGYCRSVWKLLFRNTKHPKETDTPEIEAFRCHLTVDDDVSVPMQNQAFNALQFL